MTNTDTLIDIMDTSADARQALDSKDWAGAVRLFGICLDAFPDDEDAPGWRQSRAQALLNLGRLDEAEETYLALTEEFPDMSAAFAGYARVAQFRQDWSELRIRLNACLRAFPGHANTAEWRNRLARALIELGRYGEAEDAYRTLSAERSDDPNGSVGSARLAELRSDWAQAAERWRIALGAFPDHVEAFDWRRSLAAALVEAGLYEDAEAEYRTLIAERSDDPAGLVGLARTAEVRHDWRVVTDSWLSALRRFPDHPSRWSWRHALAAAYVEMAHNDEAEAHYRILAADRSDEPAGFVGLARIAEARRDWPNTADRWQTVLDRFPDAPSTARWRTSLGTALIALRRYEEAEAVYRTLTLERPEPAHFASFARLAQMRDDWAAACERWKTCIDTFPLNPNAVNWQGALASALIGLGRFAEAEAVCRTLVEQHPENSAGVVGLARITQRQENWAEAAIHWQTSITNFPPGKPAWLMSLGTVMEKTLRWQEALQIWNRLIESEGPDRERLLGRARCLFQLAGASDETERAVAAVIEIAPKDFQAWSLSAALAHQRGNAREEYARLLRCMELRPNQFSTYQAAMDAAIRCEDFAAADRVLALAPEELSASVAFRSRVLLNYYRFKSEIENGLSLIKAIEHDPELDVVASGMVGYFLHWSYQFPALLDFSTRALEKFGPNPTILRLHLGAVFQIKGREALETEKERLLPSLGESVQASVLRRLDPAWLSFAEVKIIVDDILSDPEASPLSLQPLLNLGYRRDPETLRYLSERMASRGNRGQRYATSLLLATVQDRRLLDTANLGNTQWQEFRTAADAISAGFDAFLDEASNDGPEVAKMMAAAAALKRVMGRFGTACIFTAESYYQTATFGHWLAERIRNRVPTSVVRLSEGEGTFLPYPEAAREFQEPDQRALQQMWWGEPRILGEARDAMMRSFAETVMQADAIGVSPPRRLVIDLQNSQSPPSQRGLLAPVGFLERVDPDLLADKVLTSCHIHADLNAWDLFRSVFAGLSSISVVSCHDLAKPVADQFGLRIREWFQIPPEFKFAGMFTEIDASELEPYYPAVFERVMAEIAPLPGEVYLVAAGFLGKIICNRIRERGGIGIDIGGVSDQWAGYVTRRGTVGDLDFDLSSSLLHGQPFADTFDALKISAAEPCRSDRTRHHNLSGDFDRVFQVDSPIEQQARYQLRAIGHPRSGARYVAQIFNQLGIELGHERVMRDGICSWILAVDDLNPPYGAVHAPASSFGLTVAYVRDPAKAIPSIMLENCHSASFAYRRFHIARRLGTDIAASQDPLERAVDAYLSWMDIIDLQQPSCTLRIEQMVDDLTTHGELFASAGIVLDWQHDDSAVATTYEAPPDYIAIPEPEISDTQYNALPAALADRLRAFCKRHDYPMPGES